MRNLSFVPLVFVKDSAMTVPSFVSCCLLSGLLVLHLFACRGRFWLNVEFSTFDITPFMMQMD